MEKRKVNGFSKTQIFQLYSFLVAYEESGIQKFKTTKQLMASHPELSELEKQMKTIECKKKNALEMQDVDFKAFHNKIYLTKNKGNLLLSFLAHLRNSIAHGNVVENGGKVLITDFANPRYRPIDFTARGCVDFSVINDFKRILNSIIL